MIRVFICGAHSTGKTTLLNRLLQEPENDLHGEAEVARNVIKDLGWKRDNFEPTKHPERFFDLQRKIIQAQGCVDRKNTVQKRSYICDRGIDPFIYCQMYLGEKRLNELLSTNEAMQCLERHRAEDTLTVILEPHIECIKEDGVRLKPEMDELNRYTDFMKGFLKNHGISFETISELNLEKRVTELKSFIKRKRNNCQ